MTPKLVLLISQQEIATAVQQLAQQIDQDYQNCHPVIVGVLKGSFIFLADLIRQMHTPIKQVEMIKLSSYGSGTVSSGEVTMQLNIKPEAIAGQDVIIVEDIVDTGLSATETIQLLNQHHPNSLKLCSLLDKPARRKWPITIDYCGLTVPDKFIVGYGIDFNEQYRQLPDIWFIEQSNDG